MHEFITKYLKSLKGTPYKCVNYHYDFYMKQKWPASAIFKSVDFCNYQDFAPKRWPPQCVGDVCRKVALRGASLGYSTCLSGPVLSHSVIRTSPAWRVQSSRRVTQLTNLYRHADQVQPTFIQPLFFLIPSHTTFLQFCVITSFFGFDCWPYGTAGNLSTQFLL